MKNVDQRVLILGALIFFTLLLFVSEIWFKDDSQFFQVLAGLVANFSGAFLKDLMGSKDGGTTPAVSATKTTTVEEAHTPAEVPLKP